MIEKPDWEKVFEPLVEKWHRKAASDATDEEGIAYADCADELLAYLRESGIGALLEAGQVCRDSIGNYAVALAHRQDGITIDDTEITQCIQACVGAVRRHDAAKAKLLAKGEK